MTCRRVRSRRRSRLISHTRLRVEPLEQRMLLDAIPAASLLDMPAAPMIGEPFSFTARFDNTSSTHTGFGPYIDLYLPTTGTDGGGSEIDDGVVFTRASYLDTLVTATQIPLTDAGVPHPYAVAPSGAPIVIYPPPGYRAGDTLVVLQLPFGSFTNDQPPADVKVDAMLSPLADLNAPLSITAQGGFRYGNDPLNNPPVDATIVGAPSSTAVNPAVMRLTKTYIGPENETATGPNYPRQYRLTVDIADGQTLTNLDISDLLATNLQFLTVDATTIRGVGTATTALSTPSTSNPGGTLARRFASVTGTTAANDAELLFTFYIPRDDLNHNPVIVAATGDDSTSVDDAAAEGNWTPIDTRDDPTLAQSNVTANDHTLTNKSIALQKSVSVVDDTGATGVTPGDTLEWTLAFQISDYFAFQNLVLTDVFSDGQELVADSVFLSAADGHAPGSTSGAVHAANFTITPNYLAGKGSDQLVVRISDELIHRAFSTNGRLIGGAIPVGGTGELPPVSAPPLFGATTGTISFRTQIQNDFEYDYVLPNNATVDHHDLLGNIAAISGDLLSVANTSTVTGHAEDDGSSANVVIVKGALTKSIYAINGDTGFAGVRIAPGDTVTYRFRYSLPASDYDQLDLIDYLPLPVFHVGDPDENSGTSPNWVWYSGPYATPPAGQFMFGPGDTFFANSAIVPEVSIDAPANSIAFHYGNYDDSENRSTTIDILFTVTTSDDPFTDGLFLTNQVRAVGESTNNGQYIEDAIVQVQLTQPVLKVTKGVIATDKAAASFTPTVIGPPDVTFNAPGSATPFVGLINSDKLADDGIESDLRDVDAGDLVTFAIVVANSGLGLRGAFDVRLRDTLPAGFAIPAGGPNLQVRDGTGAVITFTSLGSGLFDPDGGIELNDPGPTNPDQGALDRYDALNGRNIAVITYDLEVQPDAPLDTAIINTATLYNYAGAESGPDHTAVDRVDEASVTVIDPVPSKSIVATSESFTGVVGGVERVAIGEIVRYRLAVSMPELNLAAVQLRDNLPAGLTFLEGTAKVAFVANGGGDGIDSSTLSDPGLDVVGNSADVSPTFVLPPSAISTGPFGSGTDVTFSLGDLTNNDRDADLEYIVVEFNALVDNSGSPTGNDAGNNLTNSFTLVVGGVDRASASSPSILVVEPLPSVVKNVVPAFGDAGDVVTFTVTYTNPAGANRATAWDTVLVDTLPAALSLTSVSFDAQNGAEGVTNNSAGNTVSIAANKIPVGGSVIVTYTATLADSVAPGQAITNTARVEYTSLPGPNGTTVNDTGSQTPGAAGSETGERTGSGTAPNDLFATDPATVTVFSPSPAKSVFATSEGSTGEGVVTIGEIIRYRLAVRIAESSALGNIRLTDSLPRGLMFLANTAKVAFVANGGSGGIDSTFLTGAGPDVSGSDPNVSPTFVLPSAAILVEPFGSGTAVTFNLGDLSNTDRDADAEYVVVEFNALVDNAGTNASDSNDAGDVLSNTFSTLRDGVVLGGPSNTVNMIVVEPVLTIAKDATATTGSVVTYRVVVTNTGAATAFDTEVVDSLPASLSLNLGSVTASAGVNYSSGNKLEIDIDSIAAGDSVTITYSANLVTTGVTITNTAEVEWTTLPGAGTQGNLTGSNTPGSEGAANGGRDSSGGINDLEANDSATLGSLGDFVWYDIDGDRLQDAGEPGIPGASMTIRWAGLDGTFNNADDSVISTTTASNGLYLASGLPVGGQYRVSVTPGTLPNGLTTPTYDFDGTGTANQATLTLTAGSPNPRDVDFGYRGSASLGNYVWNDMNADTLQTANERGIPQVGITVTWAGFDGNLLTTGDNLTYTATTNASGGYSVSNLPLGLFSVDVNQADLPGNLTLTTPTSEPVSVTLTTVQPSNNTIDFGYVGNSSLGDTVWYDVDGNGSQNNAEPGIAGVTVTLLFGGRDGNLSTGADNITYTATTDASGRYSFVGLPVGTINGSNPNYRITLSGVPPIYTARTYDLDGTGTANVALLQLLANQHRTDGDFGYRGTAELSNFVFEDLNGNGRQDGGEPGLVGASVQLYDNTGVNVLATTTTAAGGLYSFPGLVAGTYQVKFLTPAGYVPTAANQGANDAIDSDASVTTGFSPAVTLTTGATNNTVDAGFYRLLTVGDTVWYDANNNGVKDAGEPGLSGVQVTLISAGADGTFGTGDDVTLPSATTDANGNYTIPNVPPGQTRVTTSNLPAGLTNPTSDLDGTGTPNQATFAAVSAINRTDVDFGYRGTASLGDFVWNDMNGNGNQDPGEPGIPGVEITVTWAGFDGILASTGDNVTYTTTTDAAGGYSVSNLPPGSFRVDVNEATLPANLVPTTSPEPWDLALAAGASNNTIDFGYVGPSASLGDTVWYDRDGDAARDADETGIAGVTVTLLFGGRDGDLGTQADNISYTAVTDTNGEYLFEGLPVGAINGGSPNYRITLSNVPAIYTLATYDLDGTSTIGSAELQLQAAQNRRDADFGYRGEASLGDLVWHDRNANQLRDSGEPGLGGLPVRLYDATGNNLIAATTTAPDGGYLFAGLVAGTYQVRIDTTTLMAGFAGTLDPDGVTDSRTSVVLGPTDARLDLDFGYAWPPVAVNDISRNNPPGPVTLSVTGNDSDPENDLNVASVDLNPGSPGRQTERVVDGQGTWTVDNLGRVTFTPVAGFTLDPTPIPYTVADSGGAASNSALITIDYRPVSASDSSSGHTVGQPATVNVLGNDTKGDTPAGSTVQIYGTSGPGQPLTVAGQGTWSVTPAGAITFTPEPSFRGDPNVIYYSVKDAQGNSSYLASVTVDYVQDPVCAVPFTLVLDDPSTPGIYDVIVVDDSPAGTMSPLGVPSTHTDLYATTKGYIYFNGVVGAFNMNRVTAKSKPLTGGPEEGEINISSVNRSSRAGSLVILATDGCYTVATSGDHTLKSPIGGINGGSSLSFVETVDLTNTAFGLGSTTYSNSLGPYGNGSYSGQNTSLFPINAGSPYSLTKRITVAHTKALQQTSITAGGVVSLADPLPAAVPAAESKPISLRRVAASERLGDLHAAQAAAFRQQGEGRGEDSSRGGKLSRDKVFAELGLESATVEEDEGEDEQKASVETRQTADQSRSAELNKAQVRDWAAQERESAEGRPRRSQRAAILESIFSDLRDRGDLC